MEASNQFQPPNIDYSSEEEKAASKLMASMPEAMREFFSEETKAPELDHIPKHKPAWCMCEMPEGEFPRVTIYQNLNSLINAIASREGKDTAVWITYGTAFNLTKPITKPNGSKFRFLLLADDDKAVRIDQELPPLIIDSSLLPSGTVIQEEGWLGENNTLQHYYQEGVSKNEEKENE